MSEIRVDLNADVGESFGVYRLGHDSELMPHLTSASIACGFHAGDPAIMRATVALAVEHGVSIGAHPGFADLAGFGRRHVRLSAREIEDIVLYQTGALAGIAAAQGATVRHLKPHGALYNMAAVSPEMADAIARAARAFDRSLVLVGLSGSALVAAGRDAGLATASEGFADRAYRPDGTLVPRHEPGAVIHDEALVIARALSMVQEGVVAAVDGTRVRLQVDTLCVHGDTPGAARLARGLRAALTGAGVRVAATTA